MGKPGPLLLVAEASCDYDPVGRSEWLLTRQGDLTMPLQFHRAFETLEIWSASSDEYSFVVSFENPAGQGFHGRTGYVASWRRISSSRSAVRITGSPFKTLDDAEAACDAMLTHLTSN